ncbi:MAG: hypothetical protein AMJ79_07830 [Phycisphaerae bacterium SM23_30]|nr:MAG: hypothetical protein AMJ79_07830 [Phycisphaerae bacterium SM23_30]
MLIWLETALVIILALGGAFAGWLLSRLRRPWWLLGYILPILLLLMIGSARHFPVLDFKIPFRWITLGRLEFALLGPIVTCLFGSLWSRLAQFRLKILLAVFVVLVVLSQSAWPFAVPFFVRHRFINLQGQISDGVCLQSTGYTCGPAAAVSALYQLGIRAKEGEIALQAYTSTAGTDPDLLCRAINKLYADQGASCTYRPFKSLEELKQAGLTIVIIKFSFMIDHYVTILEITNDQVITADPVVGRRILNYKEFNQLWRRSGLTVKKINTPLSSYKNGALQLRNKTNMLIRATTDGSVV